MCGTGAGILLGLLLCAILYREPAGYVVPRFYTDGLEETSVYLQEEQDPDYSGYVVMNYVDASTPMQLVTGKAVKLETVRYYLGAAWLGALVGLAACGVLCARLDRKKTQQ